jgi:hypothetical protein
MRATVLPLLLTYATPIWAQPTPPQDDARIYDIVAAVTAERLRADVTRLVGFGTRHTLSDTLSDTRGIGAARRWIKSEFDRISEQCGGCLEVFYVAEVFPPGRRIPDSTNIVNVVAIQHGTAAPNRMVIMSGDIDNIISRGLGYAPGDSNPGANDNASGMAGTIEAARVLSEYQFNGSIVYLGLSGEEQGLYGGATVARYAKEHGWQIEAMLNNDMIGNVAGINGVIDNTHARVFSDGTTPPLEIALQELAGPNLMQAVRDSGNIEVPAVEFNRILRQVQSARRRGGEVDGTSRQLARYVDRMADKYVNNLDVMMVYRLDRFGRGGHHTPFANLGYPAVRIMETNENYNRQHQDIRVENGVEYGDVLEYVDFDYARKLTGLNVATLAALAWAPGPPANVRLSGANRPSAVLSWEPPDDAENVAGYRVYWRLTDSPTWDYSRWVGDATEHTFDGIIIDNYFFGVAAVGATGNESVVVFP